MTALDRIISSTVDEQAAENETNSSIYGYLHQSKVLLSHRNDTTKFTTAATYQARYHVLAIRESTIGYNNSYITRL